MAKSCLETFKKTNIHKMFWLLAAFVALTHAVDSIDFPVCDANSPRTKNFVVSWTGVLRWIIALKVACLTVLYTSCRHKGNSLLRRRGQSSCGQIPSDSAQVHRTSSGTRKWTVCCCYCWPGLGYRTDSEICGNQPTLCGFTKWIQSKKIDGK